MAYSARSQFNYLVNTLGYPAAIQTLTNVRLWNLDNTLIGAAVNSRLLCLQLCT
jgi:hypothetical protein